MKTRNPGDTVFHRCHYCFTWQIVKEWFHGNVFVCDFCYKINIVGNRTEDK